MSRFDHAVSCQLRPAASVHSYVLPVSIGLDLVLKALFDTADTVSAQR